MKKILSLTLAAVMLLSLVPTAFAADNDWQSGTEVVYTAKTSEAYTVTVPAQLAPGQAGYRVMAEGTWASNRKLVVTADKTVTLTNSINANDKKTLGVNFLGIESVGSNTGTLLLTEEVWVDVMPADALFGTWSGTFYYNVEMKNVSDTTLQPEDGQIVFSIDGVEYLADEGMTWFNWCDSDYNTIGANSGALETHLPDWSTILTAQHTPVSGNDTVLAGHAYKIGTY